MTQTVSSAPAPKAARQFTLLCALLAFATILLYLPTVRFGFVGYDDTDYILDNPHVASGLTLSNVSWAFTQGYAANWHPLTWLSHMLDCQLFGTRPGPAHLVNSLIHSANSVLLFWLFFLMTGFIYRSWFLAALFAFHPIHVESVAWLAERKDALSTLFLILALLAYVRYATPAPPSRESREDLDHKNSREWPRNPGPRVSGWYLSALVFFSCGLLSKPMLVTGPLVLFVLDWWPLQRLRLSSPGSGGKSRTPSAQCASTTFLKLLLEKVPFCALAAASSLITFVVQKDAGAVASLDSSSMTERFANAALSYWRYLGKILWPQRLFIPYVPELEQNAALPWVAAGALLIATGFAMALAKRRGYVIAGWFWYLITLAPVIGIIKVGSQMMADRYTYIPSIGIFFLLAWSSADFFRWCRVPGIVIGSLASIVICACLALSFRQIGYWKNGVTLFTHSATVDNTNLPALNCLAFSYAADPDPNVRDPQKAVRLAQFCVQQTARTEPGFLDTLSVAQAASGQFQQALGTALEALQLPAAQSQPWFLSQLRHHIELYQAGRALR
jgi:hypothetical protein